MHLAERLALLFDLGSAGGEERLQLDGAPSEQVLSERGARRLIGYARERAGHLEEEVVGGLELPARVLDGDAELGEGLRRLLRGLDGDIGERPEGGAERFDGGAVLPRQDIQALELIGCDPQPLGGFPDVADAVDEAMNSGDGSACTEQLDLRPEVAEPFDETGTVAPASPAAIEAVAHRLHGAGELAAQRSCELRRSRFRLRHGGAARVQRLARRTELRTERVRADGRGVFVGPLRGTELPEEVAGRRRGRLL